MTIQLWPEGAPNALGSDEEDCPTLTPYLIESRERTALVIVCPGGGYGTPTFLCHTAEDSDVPAENSIRYALALSKYKDSI